ncbi:T6SS immunity protein Tdi1 domain-containing protein [Listeria newyorkensis]|uniref:DUF1851 domain-containing protein n=1 Tax=Listeria newyorkensis TaxID=1497681 RepID=A0A841YZ19_9LIST|nr:T6SS immunity protein Tdi1 domain-containing protein [Listeria newyorkensis]MBC1458182.1 DUF1851 domain-containing protein [Listeria newyorkensis]
MIDIPDFKHLTSMPEEVINQYKDKIPEELISVWNDKGLGSFSKGYLRVINPNDYLDILKDSYARAEKAIPIFTTAMGDILVWEDGYVLQLKYRKGGVEVAAGKFKFFFKNAIDDYFLEKALDWAPYEEAIKLYGEPDYDECFGYTPLLGLGGPEKVDNLEKVKLKEHIYLITQFMGELE